MVKSAVENSSSTPPSAYLAVDGRTVYEVAPNSVLNIGRMETNDVVLDDYKVSREHAVLKYAGGEFTLIDLASTHGTLVNDERLERSPVRLGDRIQIANHELVLSAEVPRENHGAVLASKTARTLDRRLKFFGGLNDFALITLVQFLAQEKQSGLLLLEPGRNPGPRLYFLEGEIIHVAGEGDLADLLTREHHEESLFFYFHHETHFPPRTIQETTAGFLMNLCQTHDENREKKVQAAIRAAPALAATTRLDLPQ